MSYTKNVTIWCDGEDCGCWENGMAPNVAKARRFVQREKGWVRIGNRDFCPRCAKEQEKK